MLTLPVKSMTIIRQKKSKINKYHSGAHCIVKTLPGAWFVRLIYHLLGNASFLTESTAEPIQPMALTGDEAVYPYFMDSK